MVFHYTEPFSITLQPAQYDINNFERDMKGQISTIKGDNSIKIVLLPSEKLSTLKGKHLLPSEKGSTLQEITWSLKMGLL